MLITTRWMQCRILLWSCAVLSVLPASASIPESCPSNLGELTLQASRLYKVGKLNEAIAVQHQAIDSHRSEAETNASAHANLSFLAWQQGNIILAVAEGEESVRLAPDVPLYRINLARMKESLSDIDSAIGEYRRVSFEPSAKWKADLAVARCMFKKDCKEDGLKLLERVLEESKSFESAFAVAETSLQASQTALAVQSCQRALSLSGDRNSREKASSLLLLALLRDNQIDKASKYKSAFFKSSGASDYEIYIRIASQLVSAKEPEEGKKLLNAAFKNLRRSEDAEGFYRLGRIFQNKACLLAGEKGKADTWTALATEAYKKAVSFDSFQSRYHLALASVLEKQGDISGFASEINKAALNQFDKLAGYYQKYQSDSRAISPLAEKVKETSPKSSPFLEKVSFKISGLSCGCHTGKLESIFSKIEGVAFANISKDEPLIGTLLIDKAAVCAEKVLAECLQVFSVDPMQVQAKTPSVVVFSELRCDPVSGAEEAIRTAQNLMHGNVLEFYNQFRAQEPSLPVNVENGEAVSSRLSSGL